MWGTCWGSCAGLSPLLGDPLWSHGSVGVSHPWTGGTCVASSHVSVYTSASCPGIEWIRLLSLSFGHVPVPIPLVLAARRPWPAP